VAEEAFQDYRGALVAIDPSTGRVLALVSRPGFDPNLFVDGIDRRTGTRSTIRPNKPLNNRALRGQYPRARPSSRSWPGRRSSTRSARPEFSIADPGFFTLAGVSHRYRDLKKDGHGVGQHAQGSSCLVRHLLLPARRRLGDRRDPRLPRRSSASAPRPASTSRASSRASPVAGVEAGRFKQKWYAGDTVSIGIGQGYMLATPLQLAAPTATLANGGTPVHPRLLKAVQDSKTLETRESPRTARRSRSSPSTWRWCARRWSDVTSPAAPREARRGRALHDRRQDRHRAGDRHEAGREVRREALREEHRDHALFIAFAPADDPSSRWRSWWRTAATAAAPPRRSRARCSTSTPRQEAGREAEARPTDDSD
jgi:penicillin-binding protein 2